MEERGVRASRNNIHVLQLGPNKPDLQEEHEEPVNPLLHVHPPVLLQTP
jgi:hypothetical protein